MEQTREQMIKHKELMALETEKGKIVVDMLRAMIQKDGKLDLEQVMLNLKAETDEKLPAPEQTATHTSWMALAEIMVKIMNHEAKDLDIEDQEKTFTSLTSFYASRYALLVLQTYLSLTILYSRDIARKKKWNGWPTEEKWKEWQEHMEALVGCMEVLIRMDDVGTELV